MIDYKPYNCVKSRVVAAEGPETTERVSLALINSRHTRYCITLVRIIFY